MPRVHFTQNIQRHVECADASVPGVTVREALEAYFADNEPARSYVVDEQGALRHHMAIFVDGQPIGDRTCLSDPVGAEAEIFVLQALSGG